MLAQRSELLDGTEVPLFAGVFAIFGHGNVLGLGTALHDVARRAAHLARPERAGHGARRRRLRAGHRPPPGDGRDLVDRPGRAQHGHRRRRRAREPAAGAAAAPATPSPAARPTRCCSRSSTSATRRRRSTTRSARSPGTSTGSPGPSSCSRTLPQVARVLTDPADAGPVVLALPQDVQVEEYDFPVAMFEPRAAPRAAAAAGPRRARGGRRRRSAPPSGRCWCSAAACATRARPPRRWRFAEAHGVPVVETVAGPHARAARPPAVRRRRSASSGRPRRTPSPREADVVLAVGTRLQDFTTSSWTGFAPGVRLVHRQRRPLRRGQARRARASSATPGRRSSSSTRRWATGRRRRRWAAAPPR